MEQRDEEAQALVRTDDARRVALLTRSARRDIAAWPPGDVFSERDQRDVSA